MSTRNRRPGPVQAELLRLVAAQPGIRPWHAAKAVGPHGSSAYGGRVISRSQRRGWVTCAPDPAHAGWGQLYLTDAGQSLAS